MGIVDSQFRTISCNACDKSVTYDRQKEKETFDDPENVWLKSVRQITSLDQRVMAYCSDVCEVTGVGTGAHNLPEPKKIIETTGASAAQIKMAADAAKAAEEATKIMKSGGRIQA